MLLKHICPVCGKTISIDKPRCDEHSSRHNRYDMSVRYDTDKKIHDFYTCKEWKAVKTATADKYSGLCLWSYFKYDDIKPYDEIHHIISVRDCWQKRLDPDNLIPLSHEAHMFIEAEYRKGGKLNMQAELFKLKRIYEKEFSLR